MSNPVINKRIISASGSLNSDLFPGPPPDFHLDASRITGLATGSAVSTWEDISGNGRNFTQGTAGNQPTWQAGVLFGKAIVRFVTDDFMSCATLVSAQSWTLFTVIKSLQAAIQLIFFHGSITDGFGLIVDTTRNVQSRNLGAVVNSVDATFSLTKAEQWSVRRDNSGPLLELWVNRVAQTLTNSGAAQGAPGTSAVLAAFAGGILPFSGDMAEFIGYSTVLNDAQRAAIERYLIRKYDIT